MGRAIMLGGLIFLAFWGEALWAGTDNWRNEFDRICAMTGSAAQLSQVELEALIVDSDRLREQIAAAPEAEGKVYLFRLRKCRDFFLFMRDSRTSPGATGGDLSRTPGSR